MERYPDVAKRFNNLAMDANHGRFIEAEPLLVQALAMFQQRLGNQHPYTVGTQQRLENVRQRMGQSTEKAGLSWLGRLRLLF